MGCNLGKISVGTIIWTADLANKHVFIADADE
jgi:hypothetical protein